MSWVDDFLGAVAGDDYLPGAESAATDNAPLANLFPYMSGEQPTQETPATWGREAAADRQPVAVMDGPAQQKTGMLDGLAQRLGLQGKNGASVDYSDPKTIDAIMKAILGGGTFISSLMRSKTTPQNYKSAAELKAELMGPSNNWTPQQQTTADAFFNKPMVTGFNRPRITADMLPSPLVAGRPGYAMGGSVQPTGVMPMQSGMPPMQPGMPPQAMQHPQMPMQGQGMPSQLPPQAAAMQMLQQGMRPMGMMNQGPAQAFGRMGGRPGFAHGGPTGHVSAHSGGQDDVVPINAAGGEYVMDADVVAALGDGNNAAGAAKLDELRRKLRAHKRSAPPDKIPPKAKAPEQYMKGK